MSDDASRADRHGGAAPMPKPEPGDARAPAAAPPTLVSLGAYGAALAAELGQAALARIAAAAGAGGVEFRGELQRGGAGELAEEAGAAREHGLAVVWSSPEGLWDAAGRFDRAALDRAFETAAALGAARVKLSLGGWHRAADVDALLNRLDARAGEGIELLVENDQTVAAGTVPPLADFFARADAAGRRVPMTFDIGNWCWLGEDPLDAAYRFAPRVGYVHCKGVQRLPAKWVAVELDASALPWRRLLRALPADVPRAIECPLQGEDLVATTRRQLALMVDEAMPA